MSNIGRNLLLWAVIAILLVVLYEVFGSPRQGDGSPRIAYSELIDNLDRGELKRVYIDGRTVTGELKSGDRFTTSVGNDPWLARDLAKAGVQVSFAPADDDTPSLLSILISSFPIVLMLGIWLFVMRQMRTRSTAGAPAPEPSQRLAAIEDQLGALGSRIDEIERTIAGLGSGS
ncbi:MAG TPA: ATP-dependent metallopeptidase FtsH/Yme1/Tma family protein [Stellaceae bacterium]|nr:ATP-dependent metallopeptidase FtsH/Yme1/Tma family protein [Stellaceae bacterium]